MIARFLVALVVAHLICQGIVRGDDPAEDPRPHFEIVARLELPSKARFPGNEAFRAVALSMPWVYAIERRGSLYVFKIDDSISVQELPPVHVFPDAGDGNDLKVLGGVLLCTRRGALEAYSLKDPARPQSMGRAGPAQRRYDSQSIVSHGKLAFVVGNDGILTYDLSDSTKPKLLSVYETSDGGWVGCVANNVLSVGGRKRDGKEGIAVYDISDPANLVEVGFLPTIRRPYHLFSIAEDRALASFDAGGWFRITIGKPSTVHGTAAIYDLSESQAPKLAKELPGSGGRTATILNSKEDAYLVCNGVIFRLGDSAVEACFSFFPQGSTLDGFPYHGDSDGTYAALTTDEEVTVFRRVEASTVLLIRQWFLRVLRTILRHLGFALDTGNFQNLLFQPPTDRP